MSRCASHHNLPALTALLLRSHYWRMTSSGRHALVTRQTSLTFACVVLTFALSACVDCSNPTHILIGGFVDSPTSPSNLFPGDSLLIAAKAFSGDSEFCPESKQLYTS